MRQSKIAPDSAVIGRASPTGAWSHRDILAEAEIVGRVGAWAWEITTGELWWSDGVYRIFGRTPQEFPATYEGFLHYVHPDDRAEIEARVNAALAGSQKYDVRHRIVRPTGEILQVRERGQVTRAEDGTALRMLGFVQDVTEGYELRRALAVSEERYRSLAENAWDMVWTMGLDGQVNYVSPSVQRVLGRAPQEALDQPIEQIHPPESAQRITDYLERLYEAMETGARLPTLQTEQQYYRKDGSIMHAQVQVTPQVDADGQVVQILGVSRDISDRKKYEAELKRLAITDPLTGVWNRGHGERLFAADLAEARRYGPALSLLMLDIDSFKSINDTHGHQVGDQVLVEFCQRVRSNLRSSDVLARWGGEEFVIVMRHCTLDDAVPLANKLRALIADEPFDEVGSVTVSIGIAELQPDDDLESWLHRADRALYDAKQSGRDQVQVRTVDRPESER